MTTPNFVARNILLLFSGFRLNLRLYEKDYYCYDEMTVAPFANELFTVTIDVGSIPERAAKFICSI